MKINIANRAIKEQEYIEKQDIPLGYIDMTKTAVEPNIAISYDFSTASVMPVKAYTQIKDKDILFFNKNKEVLDNVNLKRLNGKLYYEPQESIEFTPNMFECSVLVKKKLKFKPTNTYNINVGALDTSDLFITKSILSVFKGGQERGLYPSNITFNNNELASLTKLLNLDATKQDFIFLLDKTFDNEVINKTINKHSNIWLFLDEESVFVNENTLPKDYTYQEQGLLLDIYNKEERSIKPKFTLNKDKIKMQYENHKVIFPYEDIAIIDVKNKGYIVISTNDILQNIVDLYKIFFDVLFYTFFNSYYQSKKAMSWITDEPIDMMAYSYLPIKRTHKKITLAELLKNNNFNIENNYNIIKFNTENDDVIFTGMSKDLELSFRKINKNNKDPKKKEGEISLLTSKHTVINYKQENIYLIEEIPTIDYKIINHKVYIMVQPYKSSSKKLFSNSMQEILVPNIYNKYFLCVKEGHEFKEAKFELVDKRFYSLYDHGYIVAEIKLELESMAKVYDLRINGGGLPLELDDNYDCIDIGNVYGRPIRKGSCLIFRLPIVVKPYEDIIRLEVEKHLASGDYPIFIFE